MTARRELRLAVLLCLLGSGLVLYAVSRTWVSFVDSQQLTIKAVRTAVHGSQVVTAAQALGYVGLAGVVALAATKRWGRVLVGVLVLAAGIGVVIVVAHALAQGILVRGLDASGQFSCSGSFCSGPLAEAMPTRSLTWPIVTLVGGVLLALSGLLVAVRGRRWAALSSSYAPPAGRASAEPPATDKGVWDALDRGEDPT